MPNFTNGIFSTVDFEKLIADYFSGAAFNRAKAPHEILLHVVAHPEFESVARLLISPLIEDEKKAEGITDEDREEAKQTIKGFTFTLPTSEDVTLDDLNRQSTPHQITPLMAAIIVGNTVAIDLLLAAGVDVNLRDIHGWSALHHAAVKGKTKLIVKLLQHGATTTFQNDHGGTYGDIFRMTGYTLNSEQQIPVRNESGEIESITSQEFKARTGGVYSEELLVPKKFLLDDWAATVHPEAARELSGFAKMVLGQYRTQVTPKIYLFTPIKTDDGRTLPRSFGLGVVAGEEIKASQVVTEYTGRLVMHPEKTEDKNYQVEHIDAKLVRNLGGMIQDGFPNVILVKVPQQRGWYTRFIFITLRKVADGEPLYLDYSTHQCKFYGYIIPNLNEMRNYFRTHSIKSLLSSLEKLGSMGDSATAEMMEEATKLTYIFTTPSAMVDLLLNNIVSLADIEDCLKTPYFSTSNIGEYGAEVIEGIKLLKTHYPEPAKARLTEEVLAFLHKGVVQAALILLKNAGIFLKDDKTLRANFGFLLQRTLEQVNQACEGGDADFAVKYG